MKNLFITLFLLITKGLLAMPPCISVGNGSTCHIKYLSLNGQSINSGIEGYIMHSLVLNANKTNCNYLRVHAKSTTVPTTIYLKAWIDFNNDNVFNDVTENVMYRIETIAFLGGSLLPTQFTIPASVIPGIKKMRITISGTGAPTPCNSSVFTGETEDINVNITSFDNYCISRGNITTYEFINAIQHQVAGNIHLDTTGNNNGYYAGCNGGFSMAQNMVNNLRIFFRYPSGGSYYECVTVYMDYNQDGDFTDVGENVALGKNLNYVDLSFFIPNFGSSRTVRMRVQMKYQTYASGPCEVFTYGEVEDYSIYLYTTSGAIDDDQVVSRNKDEVRSLRVNQYKLDENTLSVKLDADPNQNSSLEIFNLSGISVYATQFKESSYSNRIDLSSLPKGMYIIRVKNGEQLKTSKFIH